LGGLGGKRGISALKQNAQFSDIEEESRKATFVLYFDEVGG
jgi:hypothetical protein